MADTFVTAYLKSTGEERRIPAHWLDNPKLGGPYSRHKAAAASVAARTPATNTNPKEK